MLESYETEPSEHSNHRHSLGNIKPKKSKGTGHGQKWNYIIACYIAEYEFINNQFYILQNHKNPRLASKNV